MNKANIINKMHTSIIIYLLIGWMVESQRKYMVFLLPSIQYQFLINNNKCVLTQIENKLIKEKKERNDSFIDKKLKEYNINIEPNLREKIIHSMVYGSFIISYFMM